MTTKTVLPCSVDEIREAMALMLDAGIDNESIEGFIAVADRFGSVDGPKGHVMRRVVALLGTMTVREIDADVIDAASSAYLEMHAPFDVAVLLRGRLS